MDTELCWSETGSGNPKLSGNPVPVLPRPPQIPHMLLWNRNRESKIRKQYIKLVLSSLKDVNIYTYIQYIHVDQHIYAHNYVHTDTYISILYKCIPTYTHTYMHTLHTCISYTPGIYIYTYVEYIHTLHSYIYTYYVHTYITDMYICTLIHAYIYTYRHACIHTYVRTYQ
jgi:hypothetical protein